MNPSVPKRSWPTVLFVGASIWCVVISLLPIAEPAWRPTAIVTPIDPSVQAAAAQLLSDTGILVRNQDLSQAGPTAIGRELAVGGYPLRLDIVLDSLNPADVHLVATAALSDGLGALCLTQAIEPLIRREADGGDWSYLAGIGLEMVQAGNEAGRFGRPVLPRWFFPVVAVLCAMLAWCSRSLGRSIGPARPYTPSKSLAWTMRRLEHEIGRIDAEAAVTRTSLAEQSQSGAIRPERTFWGQFNLHRRFRERREGTRAQAQTAALMVKLDRLAKARERVEVEIRLTERRLFDHRKRFDLALAGKTWATLLVSQGIAGLALVVVVAATVHASLALAHPGTLLSHSQTDLMLFRDDTLVGTALGAHPDLVMPFDKLCSARVMRPESPRLTGSEPPGQHGVGDTLAGASMVTVGQESAVGIIGQPRGGGSATAIAENLPPIPPSNGPICKVGTPCGYACIPTGRLCHIGQVASVGQVCGRGYISLATTCHRNPVQALSAMPAAARRPEPMAPWPTAGGNSYSQPKDGAASVQQTPASDERGLAGATQSRTIAMPPERQLPSTPQTVHVEGYDRANGTHVQSYERSAPGQGKGRGSR